MKKELELDELEKVTGGLGKGNCPYFVQAQRKSYINQCENCFYYNKNEEDTYSCSHPTIIDKENFHVRFK